MRTFRFVKGNTPDEKFAAIDKALSHFKTRLQKKVILGQAPVPISGYCDAINANGEFFKFMSPVDGVVKTVLVDVKGKMPKGVTVSVLVSGGTGSFNGATLPLQIGKYTLSVDWIVKAGMKVIAKIDNYNPADANLKIDEIWIAIPLIPSEQAYNRKEEDIDALEADQNKEGSV